MKKFLKSQILKMKKGLKDSQKSMKEDSNVNYYQHKIDLDFARSMSILLVLCDFCEYIERTKSPFGYLWNKMDTLAKKINLTQRNAKEEDGNIYYRQYNLDPELDEIYIKIDEILNFIEKLE